MWDGIMSLLRPPVESLEPKSKAYIKKHEFPPNHSYKMRDCGVRDVIIAGSDAAVEDGCVEVAPCTFFQVGLHFFDFFCCPLPTAANASTVLGGHPSLTSNFWTDFQFFCPCSSVVVQWPSTCKILDNVNDKNKRSADLWLHCNVPPFPACEDRGFWCWRRGHGLHQQPYASWNACAWPHWICWVFSLQVQDSSLVSQEISWMHWLDTTTTASSPWHAGIAFRALWQLCQTHLRLYLKTLTDVSMSQNFVIVPKEWGSQSVWCAKLNQKNVLHSL